MSIDFRLRDFFYPLPIWRLHREFSRNQWLPLEQSRKEQFVRLRTQLQWAYDEVPYYRDLFTSLDLHPQEITDLETFRQLPKLEKDSIRVNGGKLLARTASRFSPTACHTSGTTAHPLTFYLDRGSQILEFVYYWRYWGWSGYHLGSRFADLSSHHFIARKELSQLPFVLQKPFRRLLLNGNLLNAEGSRQMADAIRDYRPRFLKGTPSNLYSLALGLRESGVNDLPFDAVFSGGEVVTPHTRHVIEETFNAPLRDSYGHMERTVAAGQCSHGSYHVNLDYGLMELEPIESAGGEGPRLANVIGTSLHNRAMPLIRFSLSDTVELEAEGKSCPCGRTFPLIKGIHGREADVILAPDGRRISALTLVTKLISGIDYIQFIQERENALRVIVVSTKERAPDYLEQIAESTRRITGPSIHITVEEVPNQELRRDPSGKIRPVVGLSTRN